MTKLGGFTGPKISGNQFPLLLRLLTCLLGSQTAGDQSWAWCFKVQNGTEALWVPRWRINYPFPSTELAAMKFAGTSPGSSVLPRYEQWLDGYQMKQEMYLSIWKNIQLLQLGVRESSALLLMWNQPDWKSCYWKPAPDPRAGPHCRVADSVSPQLCL